MVVVADEMVVVRLLAAVEVAALTVVVEEVMPMAQNYYLQLGYVILETAVILMQYFNYLLLFLASNNISTPCTLAI